MRKCPRASEGALYLYQQMRAISRAGLFGVEVDESDLLQWRCYISPATLKHYGLHQVARQLGTWSEMAKGEARVVLAVRFPRKYPKEVPFVRVVRPRFCFHTGHVTVGGSFCNELLTPGGWREMDVTTLLTTLCVTLQEGNARVQLAPDPHCGRPFEDYGEAEAEDAYVRVAKYHGWAV